MSVEVQLVSKLYGKQLALDEVSFKIKKGEITGLLGPNGAGKSTMMKILTCYIQQSGGRVNVAGFDVLEEAMSVKKQVGYLPEHNPLYKEMYIKEYLAFCCGVHGVKNSDKVIKEMVALTGLTLEQHKKIGALSKGYRQRVGLAQAMIHNPSVLILDEPTTGLDPNQLVEIRNLIKEIGREKTVILSTHIMQEVAAVCSRALIINKGKLIADEHITDLKNKFGTSGIIVVFSEPINKEKLRNHFPKKVSIQILNDTRIQLGGAEDLSTQVMQFALNEKYQIASIEPTQADLETIFHQLTK
ncbi:MAG: hypothetical protein RIQ89_1903 [Bacteroidota bacterium]|jgi:ABC-2 type transport system ATP-binding protein